MSVWLTIAGMGLVTFGTRILPFLAVERLTVPPRVQDALRYVPIAVLSAIVAQEVIAPGGDVDISGDNLRLFAGATAIAVAAVTRTVLVTLGAGMAVLWALQGLT
jgi:branched-subunit amino acid transport protein